MDETLAETVALLRARNAIDAKIAKVIGRPVTAGHLGEWFASRIFGIELEESAATEGYDGHFRTGPLAGRKVNIKWYMKRTGLLDTTAYRKLDDYLVLTGPPAQAGSSRGLTRPWCVQGVFLFDAVQLGEEQSARGISPGIARSVRHRQWDAAELYPQARNSRYALTPEQFELLALLRPDAMTPPDDLMAASVPPQPPPIDQPGAPLAL